MTEMVERVTRAIIFSAMKQGSGLSLTDLLHNMRHADRYDFNNVDVTKLARAAISAMRVPTDNMFKKGVSAVLIAYCDADPIANFPDEEVKIWEDET